MSAGRSRTVPGVVPLARARAVLERRDWDAIVVGAGIGGLVAGALLTRAGGMRVLVLERHHEIGGLSQTFHRRRFEWDVGVHYVGDLGPGGTLRALYDQLTDRRLAWAPLPELHDLVIATRVTGRVGGTLETMEARLNGLAPGQDAALRTWLEEIRACARAAVPHLLGGIRATEIDARRDRSPFFRWADATTAEVLARLGIEGDLAQLLIYSWGNYGTRPDRSSFAAHAIAMAHYFSGAAYPVGGGSQICRELVPALLERGALVVRAEVDTLLVEGGLARGVRLVDGRELFAPIVVSDAGARTTAMALGRDVPELDDLRERVSAIGPSEAHVGLYLGYERTPAELGLDGTNLWLGEDPLRGTEAARAWAAGETDEAPGIFVSAACARDPSAAVRLPGRAAITATVSAPYAPFARWEGTAWAKRGESYDAHKERLLRSLLARLRRDVPALASPDYVELSTPLSTRHFTSHSCGEVAGLAHTPTRFRRGPSAATAVRGLFLAGQDLWLGGVGGASFGGVLTASTILRRDLAREVAMRGAALR
jgi:all-trans-retinol 13,14-reductase